MKDGYEEKIYKKIKKKKERKAIQEIIYNLGQFLPILYVFVISYLATLFILKYIAEAYETDFIRHILEHGFSGIMNDFIILSFMMFGVLFITGMFCLLAFKSFLVLKFKGYKPKKSYFEKILNYKKENKQNEVNNDKND